MPDYLKRVIVIFFAALIFAVIMFLLNEGYIKFGAPQETPKPFDEAQGRPSHTHEPGTPLHVD